jgi:hypothetical protein
MMCTMGAIMEGCHRCILEHVKLAPRLAVEELEVKDCGRGTYRVRVRIANRGQLP